MKVLHINAAPRGEDSRTLSVSQQLLERYSDATIDEVHLFEEGVLPALTRKRVDGKYSLMSGKSLEGEEKKSWEAIEAHIDRFLSADVYVVSTPMWNFGIPYFLKHYIDVIFQPGYLFHYTENGPEGLAKDKKMYIISSRGGDYSEGSPAAGMDYIEPYLKAAFGFVGISDITTIAAQPMDAGGEERRKEALQQASEKVASLDL